MVLGLDGFTCRNPFAAFPLGTCLLDVPTGRSCVGYAATGPCSVSTTRRRCVPVVSLDLYFDESVRDVLQA
jgi:hypothetical protein